MGSVGNSLYGRGSSDMLAAIAGYIVALRSVRALGGPAIDVEVHSVSNEELGGNGTLAVLQRTRIPDWVVIGEPTGNRLSESTLGFHHFTVEIAGASSHMSSIAPGESAIERLPSVLLALGRARVTLGRWIRDSTGFESYDASPLAVGMVSGGRVPAVPPAVCFLDGVAYSAPGVGADEVEALLVSELAGSGDVRVCMRRMSFSGNGQSRDRGLFDSVAASWSAYGRQPILEGFPSPCDLRHYSSLGSAGLVFGPGELSVAHAADERVSTDALSEFTSTFAHFMLNPGPRDGHAQPLTKGMNCLTDDFTRMST